MVGKYLCHFGVRILTFLFFFKNEREIEIEIEREIWRRESEKKKKAKENGSGKGDKLDALFKIKYKMENGFENSLNR